MHAWLAMELAGVEKLRRFLFLRVTMNFAINGLRPWRRHTILDLTFVSIARWGDRRASPAGPTGDLTYL